MLDSPESRVGQAMHRLLEWTPLDVDPNTHLAALGAQRPGSFSWTPTSKSRR